RQGQDRLRHLDRRGGRAGAVRLFVSPAAAASAMRRLRVLKFAFFPETRREAGGIESARGRIGKGALGQQGQGQGPAVSLAKTSRRGRAKARNRALRPRLLDGLAADLRSEGPGAPRLIGDGLVRRPRLRDLVHGPRGL